MAYRPIVPWQRFRRAPALPERQSDWRSLDGEGRLALIDTLLARPDRTAA